jgi:putative DNA primase/helicase
MFTSSPRGGGWNAVHEILEAVRELARLGTSVDGFAQDISPEVWGHKVAVLIAPAARQKEWEGHGLTVRELALLQSCPIPLKGKSKDTLSVVLVGTTAGSLYRRKENLERVTGIGLDDDGVIGRQRCATAARKSDVFVIQYSTASDGKNSEHKSTSVFAEWARRSGVSSSPTPETAAAFLNQNCKHGPAFKNVQIAMVGAADGEHQFTFDPQERTRTLVPFSRPLEGALLNKLLTLKDASGNTGFKVLCLEIEKRVLGTNGCDEACMEPMRVHYAAARREDSPASFLQVSGHNLFDPVQIAEEIVRRLEPFHKQRAPNARASAGGWDAVPEKLRKSLRGVKLASLMEDQYPELVQAKGSGSAPTILKACPFAEQHSSKRGEADNSAYAYDPQPEKGHLFPTVRCRHASCANRKTDDFVSEMIERGELTYEAVFDNPSYRERYRFSEERTIAPDIDLAIKNRDFYNVAAAVLDGDIDQADVETQIADDKAAHAAFRRHLELAHHIRASRELVSALGRGFWQDERGEVYEEVNEGGDVAPLCSPLIIDGTLRDHDGGGRTLVVLVRDDEDNWHVVHLRRRELTKKKNGWLEVLQDKGFRLAHLNNDNDILQLLLAAEPKRRIRAAQMNGWQEGNVFLYGAELIAPDGYTGDDFYLPSAERFSLKGSLEDWRQNIAAKAVGNPSLMVEIAQQLSSPLLRPLGMDGGGIHWSKGTSQGKTTAMNVGASVYSGCGFVLSWNNSEAFAYDRAAQRNDLSMPMDEIRKARSAKDIDGISYGIANGEAPGRCKSDGTARQRLSGWRVTMPSNGERTPSEQMAFMGGKPEAGMDVRLVPVPWLGFQTFHDAEGGTPTEQGKHFADQLKKDAREKYFGIAGREFIRCIVSDYEQIVEHAHDVKRRLERLLSSKSAAAAEARVVERFAVIGAAGVIAIEQGILPWTWRQMVRSVLVVYRAWLGARGGHGVPEVITGLHNFERNMIAHGSSRFVNVDSAFRTLCPQCSRVHAQEGQYGRILVC